MEKREFSWFFFLCSSSSASWLHFLAMIKFQFGSLFENGNERKKFKNLINFQFSTMPAICLQDKVSSWRILELSRKVFGFLVASYWKLLFYPLEYSLFFRFPKPERAGSLEREWYEATLQFKCDSWKQKRKRKWASRPQKLIVCFAKRSGVFSRPLFRLEMSLLEFGHLIISTTCRLELIFSIQFIHPHLNWKDLRGCLRKQSPVHCLLKGSSRFRLPWRNETALLIHIRSWMGWIRCLKGMNLRKPKKIWL